MLTFSLAFTLAYGFAPMRAPSALIPELLTHKSLTPFLITLLAELSFSFRRRLAIAITCSHLLRLKL